MAGYRTSPQSPASMGQCKGCKATGKATAICLKPNCFECLVLIIAQRTQGHAQKISAAANCKNQIQNA